MYVAPNRETTEKQHQQHGETRPELRGAGRLCSGSMSVSCRAATGIQRYSVPQACRLWTAALEQLLFYCLVARTSLSQSARDVDSSAAPIVSVGGSSRPQRKLLRQQQQQQQEYIPTPVRQFTAENCCSRVIHANQQQSVPF